MIFTNLINGSDEQQAGLDYLPNERDSEPVSIIAGRYYLAGFALKTTTRYVPPILTFACESGLTITKQAYTTISSNYSTSPTWPTQTQVFQSIGIWLYGGYATANNPEWSFSIQFGRTSFSSFAYCVDEVQGTSTAPVVQTGTALSTTVTLPNAVGAGNATYMLGMSMVPNMSYPVDLTHNADWAHLAHAHYPDVVPNFFSGFSLLGNPSPGWLDLNGAGRPGPLLEKAIVACELAHV